MTAPRRTDANQACIVAALRAVGVWVWDTHELGFGFPDLVTWRDGDGYRLVEVKGLRGRLTDWEQAFIAVCPGEVCVVRSIEEAFRAHGIEEEHGR